MSIAMPAVEEPQAQSRTQSEQTVHTTPNGRVRVEGLSDADRNYAVAIHLSPLAVAIFFPIGIVAPLVLWLARKDRSPFNDDHGREVMNFLISFIVLHLFLAMICVTIIGIPFAIVGIVVLWVVGFISIVRGAIAGGHGEYFRYPMTLRFLN